MTAHLTSPLGRPKLPPNHQSRFLTPTWFCQALSTSEKMLVSSCHKSLWVIPDRASPVKSYPMSSACSRFKMHLASIPLIHDHSQEPGEVSHAPITMATSVSSGSFLSARRSLSLTHHSMPRLHLLSTVCTTGGVTPPKGNSGPLPLSATDFLFPLPCPLWPPLCPVPERLVSENWAKELCSIWVSTGVYQLDTRARAGRTSSAESPWAGIIPAEALAPEETLLGTQLPQVQCYQSLLSTLGSMVTAPGCAWEHWGFTILVWLLCNLFRLCKDQLPYVPLSHPIWACHLFPARTLADTLPSTMHQPLPRALAAWAKLLSLAACRIAYSLCLPPHSEASPSRFNATCQSLWQPPSQVPLIFFLFRRLSPNPCPSNGHNHNSLISLAYFQPLGYSFHFISSRRLPPTAYSSNSDTCLWLPVPQRGFLL